MTYRSSTVVSAIRLALEAGADDNAKVAVIERLVLLAPDTDGRETEPVEALVAAVKESRAQFSVTPAPSTERRP